ncbi:MAG: hypothetical protein AAF702_35930 [Chloroflexota bacterium]
MTTIDLKHYQRAVISLSMILAPLAMLIGWGFLYQKRVDPAPHMEAIANNVEAWLYSHLFFILAIALYIPVIAGLYHLLRYKRTAYTDMGVSLTFLGILANSGQFALDLIQIPMAMSPERDLVNTVLEQASGLPLIQTPFFTLSIGFFIGVLYFALAIGFFVGLAMLLVELLIYRLAPRWMSATAIIGVLLTIFGEVTEWMPLLAWGMIWVGMASIGNLLRQNT